MNGMAFARASTYALTESKEAFGLESVISALACVLANVMVRTPNVDTLAAWA